MIKYVYVVFLLVSLGMSYLEFMKFLNDIEEIYTDMHDYALYDNLKNGVEMSTILNKSVNKVYNSY